MKRLLLLIGMSIFAVGLVACGTNDEDTSDTDDPNNNATEENDNASDDATNDTDDNSDKDADQDENASPDADKEDDQASDKSSMESKMEDLGYKEFELEVEYANHKEYEAEIKQDNGKVEAELEDELNNVDIEGQEAFDKIYPNMKKLDIEKDTKKSEVISQTLKAFDLKDDYEEFEVEITFNDGSKLEVEDKQ